MGSPPESVALAIAPKFTALLSICGSLGIVLKVLYNKNRLKKPMHRIMLGMSVCDILASIWYFIGTWVIPRGTLSRWGNGITETVFWAAGDQNGISCNAAGYFNQFAVATPLYNLTLSIFYLLVVKFSVKDYQILNVEWLFHVIPVGYAFLTATFAAVTQMYGHVDWTCWILPPEIFDETKEATPIQSKFQLIQWIFLFGPVWMCIIVVTIIFIILYCEMKQLELKMVRYSFTKSNISIVSSRYSYQSTDGIDVEKKMKPEKVKHGIETQVVAPEYDDSANSNKEEKILSSVDVVEAGTGNYDDEEQQKEIVESSHPGTTTPRRENTKKSVTWIANTIIRTFNSNNIERDKIARRKMDTKSKKITRKMATKSKQIAVQGLLYVAAFYITWLFPTISRITELRAGRNYFPIQLLDTFLIPLQGFLNFCIYIRPQFLKYRKTHPDHRFWNALKTVVFEKDD